MRGDPTRQAELMLGVTADSFVPQHRPMRRRHLLSDEHFSVDGTLIQAWASMKRVRPVDDDDQTPSGWRAPEPGLQGQRRINDTHRSRTDPDARLARKGDGESARLAYTGHGAQPGGRGTPPTGWWATRH